MQRPSRRRLLAAMGGAAAVAVTAPVAFAAPQGSSSDVSIASRPNFKLPFRCGQTWRGSNWNGHSPAHSIDWNHYDANGNPDDFGRAVLASAGGEVLASYYATNTGYGNTIVIGHGNGWRTRYAHLRTRSVGRGAHVSQGQLIGEVGASSAIYNLSRTCTTSRSTTARWWSRSSRGSRIPTTRCGTRPATTGAEVRRRLKLVTAAAAAVTAVPTVAVAQVPPQPATRGWSRC